MPVQFCAKMARDIQDPVAGIVLPDPDHPRDPHFLQPLYGKIQFREFYHPHDPTLLLPDYHTATLQPAVLQSVLSLSFVYSITAKALEINDSQGFCDGDKQDRTVPYFSSSIG